MNKYNDLNIVAAAFNVEFSLGKRTTADIEAQAMFSFLNSDIQKKISRLISLYGLSPKISRLLERAADSSAKVTIANDGYIEMKESEHSVVFKMRSLDLYLDYFLDITPRFKYYQLLYFYFSFSPYLELFAFNEGLDRLDSLKEKQ